MAKAGLRTEAPETKRRRFRIRPAYVVLLLVMAFFTFKFVEKTKELQQLTREANTLRVENLATIKDTNRIKREIGYFRTQGYIESRARSLFGYASPGDVNIVVTPRIQPRATVKAGPRIYVPPQPTWKQWWSSFFG
jgi:cell division protein FtsB